jgi:hypothetical protein
MTTVSETLQLQPYLGVSDILPSQDFTSVRDASSHQFFARKTDSEIEIRTEVALDKGSFVKISTTDGLLTVLAQNDPRFSFRRRTSLSDLSIDKLVIGAVEYFDQVGTEVRRAERLWFGRSKEYAEYGQRMRDGLSSEHAVQRTPFGREIGRLGFREIEHAGTEGADDAYLRVIYKRPDEYFQPNLEPTS